MNQSCNDIMNLISCQISNSLVVEMFLIPEVDQPQVQTH